MALLATRSTLTPIARSERDNGMFVRSSSGYLESAAIAADGWLTTQLVGLPENGRQRVDWPSRGPFGSLFSSLSTGNGPSPATKAGRSDSTNKIIYVYSSRIGVAAQKDFVGGTQQWGVSGSDHAALG